MSSARAVLDLEVPAKKKPEPQARSVPPQPPPAAVSTGPGPENFKGDSLTEAEDPKDVFKRTVTVPPPPRALLRRAIEAKEKYLGYECKGTSVHTNRLGQTFCYGRFGHGTNSVNATLLYYDRAEHTWRTDLWRELPEAEDPKEVFRKMRAKQVPEEVHFGFAIATIPEELIEQFAIDRGIVLTQEQWDALNADIGALESNCMEMLNAEQIYVRNEGHDGTGALIGRAWMKPNTPGWELVRRWVETDGELLLDTGRIANNLAGGDPMLWRGVSELGRQLLDTRIEFYGAENLPGGKDLKAYFSEAHKPPPPPQEPNSGTGEDPKAFFRQMIATGKAMRFSQAYQDVLEYMPDEFKAAFRQGKFAEWQNNDPAVEWSPVYDDEADRWYEESYYFVYYTEDRKLFIVARMCDKDGNNESMDSAEVGTKEAATLIEEYGVEGWLRSMRDYWQWVIEHGEDPLGYIRLPTMEVQKQWWVGFVREGDKMRVAKVRQLVSPTSPPAVDFATAKAKAATDQEWAKLLEYCLVDDACVTEATEAQIVGDGGKWKNDLLVLKVVFTDTKTQDVVEDYIVLKAQEALDQLNHDGQANH